MAVFQIRAPAARKSESWRKRFPGFVYLLSPSATKIDKSNASQKDYYNVVQYLAPATMAGGANLCPSHTPGCYGAKGENCIAGTGRLEMARSTLVGRTKFFLGDSENYLERLLLEIDYYRAHAKAAGRKLALRLNGTSDIAWEQRSGYRELFGMFPDVQFYDYTKVASRVIRDGKPVPLPENYHLTFSQSELNKEESEEIAKKTPTNVAIVFWPQPGTSSREAEPLPESWYGREVIDGDLSDLRFADRPSHGAVVGLRAKGGLRRQMREAGSPGSRFVILPDDPHLAGKVNDSAVTDRRSGCGRGTPELAVQPIATQAPSAGAGTVREKRISDWMNALAKTSQPYVAEHYAGPWTFTLGSDEWVFATNAHAMAGVRASGYDYPPMPRAVSTVLIKDWLDPASKNCRLSAEIRVKDLLKICGGRTKVRTWSGWHDAKIDHPVLLPLPGSPELPPCVVNGRLLALALDGAPPNEMCEVNRFAVDVSYFGAKDYMGIFIRGAGWLAIAMPIGSPSQATLDAAKSIITGTTRP